ncbi:MAG: glycosyl hydrolase family 28 protein [Opitutaceae bacterium]
MHKSNPCLPLAAFLILSAFPTSGLSSVSAPKEYVISEHGAVGDGTTVNTKAIQAAIDACSAAGGGVIIVPKGVFLSGALYFKPGVSLEVEQDGVLKSTTSMADFPPIYTNWEGIERYWTSGFLNFIGVNDISVSGDGTIDGSGLAFPGNGQRGGGPRGARGPGPGPRRGAPPPQAPAGPLPKPEDVYPSPLPTVDSLNFAPDPAHLPIINAAGLPVPGGAGRLSPPRSVVFQNCSNIRVSGLHLKNQAKWGFVFLYCRNVIAENLTVSVDSYIPSSDGMDVCSSQYVRITGCSILCTDDDISIKAGKDADGLRVNRPSEYITISDCTFGSGSGVAMGSEVSGSIRHVLVQRCKFNGSDTVARIKSQPSRGGEIDDIVFRDLQLQNVGRAIAIELSWRMVGPMEPPAKVLTTLSKVRLINVSGTAQSVGVIQGFKDKPVKDVTFENCQVEAKRGLTLSNADVNTTGLTITGVQGEPVIHAGAAGQPQ